MGDIINDFSSMTNDLSAAISEFRSLLQDFSVISELGLTQLINLFVWVESAVVSLIVYAFEALPTYRLAKNSGRKHAWLAWIPLFGKHFRLFVLCDICKDKEFSLLDGKYRIKNRYHAFLIYLGIAIFGNTLITSITGIFGAIPVIGMVVGYIATILYLIPKIAIGLFEYIYLRDVMDVFKKDKKINRITAIIITVLDILATRGLVRAIYLLLIRDLAPLPQDEAETKEASTEEEEEIEVIIPDIVVTNENKTVSREDPFEQEDDRVTQE